jgi:hypothetical protein
LLFKAYGLKFDKHQELIDKLIESPDQGFVSLDERLYFYLKDLVNEEWKDP